MECNGCNGLQWTAMAILARIGSDMGGDMATATTTATCRTLRACKKTTRTFSANELYRVSDLNDFTSICHENIFCLHLTVVSAKICEAGCQRDAPAKGFAKRSTRMILLWLQYIQVFFKCLICQAQLPVSAEIELTCSVEKFCVAQQSI